MRSSFEIPALRFRKYQHGIHNFLNHFFGGHGPSDYKRLALWRNYGRVVDKAIAEYQLARKELRNYERETTPAISSIYAAVGHMENCVSDLLRGLNFLIALSKAGAPVDRTNRNCLLTALTRVRSFRNAIQHLDGKINGGELKKGDDFFISIQKKSIKLGKEEITYVELKTWLELLTQEANRIVTWA